MKKKLIRLFIVAAVVCGIGALLISISNHGPEFEEIAYLLNPRIVTKPDVNTLVVEATGDPAATSGPAFSLLFKSYFKLKGKPKGKLKEAPRARWPKPFDTPRDKWVGIYALPVADSVQSLPDIPSEKGLTVSLRKWHYGRVAEILHAGPYHTEDTSVAKLRKYIAAQGYEISGDHEEEYLKGPGLFPTDAGKFLTIIRYQVRKNKEKQPLEEVDVETVK